jgi:complex III assembly factor LYRM7
MMKVFDRDPAMFHRVRIEARKKIIENAGERDPIKIQDHIFFGEETRDFLENNLLSVILMDCIKINR